MTKDKFVGILKKMKVSIELTKRGTNRFYKRDKFNFFYIKFIK